MSKVAEFRRDLIADYGPCGKDSPGQQVQNMAGMKNSQEINIFLNRFKRDTVSPSKNVYFSARSECVPDLKVYVKIRLK